MLTPGKLPPSLLQACLALCGAADPRVTVGPRFGEDCAVIDLGTQYLIVKTDPVTFTAEEVGWYAVHVNANDVATMGAPPSWFQACLLFPPHTADTAVRLVFTQIDAACTQLGIAVTGGHTEVTNAVTRPVVIGNMQGLVAKDRLVTSSGARPGDLVVMTKTAGIEGTSILATEKAGDLRGHLSDAELRDAARLRYVPGISVVPEALLAAEHGATAMHDPTEGGVAMGLYELATASGVGISLDLDAIPVLPVTRTICRVFGVNPLGVISSGTLLLTIPPERWSRLQDALRERSLPAQVIGTVQRDPGIRATAGGRPQPFTYSEKDELTKIL